MRNIIFSLLLAGSAMMLASCENEDIEFSDYDYQTVYFATQNPVRKIMLGDDVYPTDNDGSFKLFATCGGVWTNRKDRTVNIAVDETLCDGMEFEDGRAVMPLPQEYYTMSSNTITIHPGEIMAGVDVQLTDAFFADPLSAKMNYVLPVRIVSASDSILSGKPKAGVTNPNPVDADDWDVLPQNYTLYALRYKNKYHGVWLSCGTDHIYTDGTETSVNVREPGYLEKAGLVNLYTERLNVVRYPVSVDVEVYDVEKKKITVERKTYDLVLTFDGDENCTVTSDTEGFKANGTGKWEYQGAKKAWNKKDRDLLTLSYEYEFSYVYNAETGIRKTVRVVTDERLVMRDRGSDNKLETFSYKIRK